MQCGLGDPLARNDGPKAKPSMELSRPGERPQKTALNRQKNYESRNFQTK